MSIDVIDPNRYEWPGDGHDNEQPSPDVVGDILSLYAGISMGSVRTPVNVHPRNVLDLNRGVYTTTDDRFFLPPPIPSPLAARVMKGCTCDRSPHVVSATKFPPRAYKMDPLIQSTHDSFVSVFFSRFRTLLVGKMDPIARDTMAGVDSTPEYIFHPLVPYRLKMVLPRAKFIVLLRDPTER